ncbi:MAG: Eco57I restriction-modification methylase domain-containing protein [Candidatus Sabulitectum sp.]|nr:Eco57I restriction-modification methylase domain-containing protein [Candidatus Sabulitectum sp.]
MVSGGEALGAATVANTIVQAEKRRHSTIVELDRAGRSTHGQFMTPMNIACLMAEMFDDFPEAVRVLDAGAGTGSLTAAFVKECCSRHKKVDSIHSTAFELNDVLFRHLEETLKDCVSIAERENILFKSDFRHNDFIETAVSALNAGLFSECSLEFDAAILNPPYKKIRAQSRERLLLQSIGLDATNLYAAFVALSIRLLRPGGQLVAILPRSFCNGPYFRLFRKQLLSEMTLKRIHVFDSRKDAFGDDGVLQENIIVHAVKAKPTGDPIQVSLSKKGVNPITSNIASYEEVVRSSNGDTFIYLPTGSSDAVLAEWMFSLPATLGDLGIVVSTGRVIDFRAKKYLLQKPENSTVPLIYPCHFSSGLVNWPKLEGKKPNAILDCTDSRSLLIPKGYYVLVKRFSSKEERRRVVAVVYDPTRLNAERIGVENHINYYHAGGKGLDREFTFGLSVFLNSTPVDLFFRQFNGHTQVNATDLRTFRYPNRVTLEQMGKIAVDRMPLSQYEIDEVVRTLLHSPPDS